MKSVHLIFIKILRAINGENAIKIAEKEKPSIIIADWEMPIMDGIEMIKILKIKKETKDIPVILLYLSII